MTENELSMPPTGNISISTIISSAFALRPIQYMLLITFLALFCALTNMASADQIVTGDEKLNTIFEKLKQKDFGVKATAIDELANSGHTQSKQLLELLLSGDLRYIKDQPWLVTMGERVGKKSIAQGFLDQKSHGEFTKRKFKKFTINNALRGQIKSYLSTLDLRNDDPKQRLKAVQALIANGTIHNAIDLQDMLDKETNLEVKEALTAALSIAWLSSDSPQERIKAIGEVSSTLSPAVRNKLSLMEKEDSDPQVQAAAGSTLASINQQVVFYSYLETLFFGLSLGSVLVLAAIGLAITFGVMGVINMAHGELIMLGAYTTWALQQLMPDWIGLSIIVAIPVAFVVSGLVGILIERGVVQFLYGRPLDTLLATFGLSLILQQLVRTVVSAQNVPVSNAPFLSGSWQINSVLSITYSRLYIFFFCLLVFAALVMLLKRTTFGLRVRAVSQNRSMARAMGIPSKRVDSLTFGLGAGIAGIAGVALSQLTNVGPNLGQSYIIDSFMVVVFGGVGNLWGTLIAGLGLGIANKFAEPWAGAVLAKIIVLVFIILFIQKRPRGLFPQKGRAAAHA